MRLVYTDAAHAYALFRDGEGKRRSRANRRERARLERYIPELELRSEFFTD
jgi:hypothetical protein